MKSLKKTTAEMRRFGLLVGGVFCALALYFFLRNRSAYIPLAVIGGALVLTGATFPALLVPVFRVWMFIGHVLGWVNSRIILGILFFLIITPMAIAMRLIGRDPLARRLNNTASSYWEIRHGEFSAEGLKNQF